MQELSISELQEKMTSGELTARQLAELFLERIGIERECLYRRRHNKLDYLL